MAYNVLMKPFNKVNITDMGKALEQLAKKDQKLAMELFGQDPVEFLRAGDVAHDVFDKKGRLTRQMKEETITGIQEKFQLTPKEAKKEFYRLKLGDVLNMFGVKTSGAEQVAQKSGDVFEKRLAKMNRDDMFEIANQIAVKDKKSAEDIHRYGMKSFLDGANEEMFLPSGVMKPKVKQRLVDKFMQDSNLTKEEAVQKFATAKIGDVFQLQ